MISWFRKRFGSPAAPVRPHSRAIPAITRLERLESRIALASDTVARPALIPTTNVFIDSFNGPDPIVFGRSDIVGNNAQSFVVTSVANGVVEKWDASTETWRDVSTMPVSSNPRELLTLLANRVIVAGDQLRWLPARGTAVGAQKAFDIKAFDGTDFTPPDHAAVPSGVHNLLVTQTGATELTLTWDAVPTATHYTIGVETVMVDPGFTDTPFTSTLATYVTRASTYVFSDLDADAFRSFCITAINRAGAGPSIIVDASSSLWTDPGFIPPKPAGLPADAAAPTGPIQTLPANAWYQFDSVVTDPSSIATFQLADTQATSAVSGSINGLAFRPTADGGFLYAGASNGGVYARTYFRATDSWSPSWTWVSKPGTGYVGSQSIAQLAISPDGRLLAVGQGNPSNYDDIGPPGNGIQIGQINGDGSIRWLPDVATQLERKTIRSLAWTSNSRLVATYHSAGADDQDGTIVAEIDGEAGLIAESVVVANRGTFNTVFSLAPEDLLIAAGYDTTTGQNFIGTLDDHGGFTGLQEADSYLQSLDGVRIARVSVYPSLVNEPGFAAPQMIVFIGSFKTYEVKEDGQDVTKDGIAQIDRLVVDPETLFIQSYATQNVLGHVGDNQASNDESYGNFSFAADPTDTSARAVFAGGNTGYPNAGPRNWPGGLVRVTVGDAASFEAFYSQKRADEAEAAIRDAEPTAPGSPHADSRTIIFMETANGTSLIQSDDGGVWQLSFGEERSPLTSRWTTLSALGMNTLETTSADYNSVLNAIAGSYQDNGTSIFEIGGSQYLIGGGDGQFVIFDDGLADSDGVVSLYISSQLYLNSGAILRYDFTGDGVTGHEITLKLLQASGELVKLTEPKNTQFKRPIEGNAYRSANILMAGMQNLYEQVGASNASDIVFRPLLDETEADYLIMAIDNQGSPSVALSSFDSLYVAYYSPLLNDVRIAYREANPSSPTLNPTPLYSMVDEVQSNVAVPDYVSRANINDVAHRPAVFPGEHDVVYWLQGGFSVAGFSHFPNSQSQVIRYKQAGTDDAPITLDLEHAGILFDQTNPFKLQSIVFVPATETHGEKLVVGGLHGMWIADVDASGNPGQFTKMAWDGLPDEGPGSYLMQMKYDPRDDVLVASQLGHGIWLYSFTGSLGPSLESNQVITASSVTLPQMAEPLLTKRKQERNSALSIRINRDLLSDDAATVYVDLHDYSAWQENMEMVSLYSASVSTVADELNLLTGAGQTALRAFLLPDGTLRVPLTFEAHETTRVVYINAREFASPVPTFALQYSVTVEDTGFTDAARVVLESGSPAVSLLWENSGDLADPWSRSFESAAIRPPREFSGNHVWIRPGGEVGTPPATDDVFYVGAAMSLAMGYGGNDLFIVDANTWGTNWLVGGDGCDEFRLVAIEGDVPAFPQIIVDFEPGQDRISLAGLSMRDLVFEEMGNGTVLRAKGHAIASIAGVSPSVLRTQNNIVFM